MPTDIVSRVLSIFSLIIALGAIALLLSYFRLKENRDELRTTFEQHLAANAHEYTESRTDLEKKYQEALDKHEQSIDAWNTQLNAAVEGFRGEANALLARIEDDNRLSDEQRRIAFRAALEDLESRLAAVGQPQQPSALSMKVDVPAATGKQTPDPADLLPEIPNDDAIAAVSPSASEGNASAVMDGALMDGAGLRLVPSSLRPGSDQVTLVVLENLSDEPTEIRRVRFRPKSRFPLSADPDAVKPATRISFDPANNTSDNPGYHGVYVHELETPVVIPAGQRTTLRFTITDPQHNGWGFAGQLRLDYNDQQSLAIDSARVIFTP